MSVISCKDLGTDVRVLLVDHDPKTVSTDCPKGTSIIDANGVWYRKRDDGDTTNVAKMGNFNDVTTYASLPGTGVEKETYLTVDTHSEYYWNGSGWVQVNVAEKRLGGIIVSKFGNSVPSEYKHATGAAVSTYERFQSGKDNAGGAGFAGASREWRTGDGGDATAGVNAGGAAGVYKIVCGKGGSGFGGGAAGASGSLQVWHGDEVAGTYATVGHNGTNAILGGGGTTVALVNGTTATSRWFYNSTQFYPLTANTHSVGTAAVSMQSVIIGEDRSTATACSTSGLYLGLAQEARIRYNKDATGYPAACLILGLEAVGTAAKDRLAFSSATTIGQGFKALTNVDGSDTYIATQSALDNDKRGGNLYFELGAKHGTGADGIMYVYSGAVLIATFGNAEFGVFGSASAQAGHIADPTGGTTVDTEARAAIASLLTAIENYGLLAAA